jgi:hypothetical protein
LNWGGLLAANRRRGSGALHAGTRSGGEEAPLPRTTGSGAIAGAVRQHLVFALAPGLLLVFTPRGHREAVHAHRYAQRLRVLRGRLEVRTARGVVQVAAGDRPLRIGAGRPHAPRALAGTWLIAERLRPPRTR